MRLHSGVSRNLARLPLRGQRRNCFNTDQKLKTHRTSRFIPWAITFGTPETRAMIKRQNNIIIKYFLIT